MSETDPYTSRQTSAGPRPPRTEDIDARTILRGRVSVPVGPVDWTHPTVEQVAAMLPQFQVLDFIGRGGMGAVYKARQVALNRYVAIKLLPAEIAAEENFVDRFTREARTLAKLNHPHIVGIYDFGTTDQGHSWFAMEYVEGSALHTLIDAKKLTPMQTMQIMADVCEGLACAHRHGVVHRDVKPSNVLVDMDGRAKIADFGIARMETPEQQAVTTGPLFGTPSYMAPEQLERREVDHRADLYAVGVMLYEALCFQLPRGHVDPPSSRIGCDTRIDEIVFRAMQNDPTRRHQTAHELFNALRVFCGQGETVKVPVMPKPKPDSGKGETEPMHGAVTAVYQRQQLLRRWGVTAGVAAIVLVGAVLYGLTTVRSSHGGPNKIEAELPPAKQPGSTATPDQQASPLVGQWVDLMAELKTKGGLPEGIYEEPGGYRTHTPAGKPGVYVMLPQVVRDQALRVSYVSPPDGTDQGLQLILRSSLDFKELYRVHAYATDWQIVKRDQGGRIDILLTVPKNDEMKKPGPRVAEFRVEGEKLTFLFNGTVYGTVYDPAFTKGRARVHCGEGVFFQKVEYLVMRK